MSFTKSTIMRNTRLREAGVEFLMQPQEIETAVGRRKIAFFEAPGGIRTEVMEILEDWENNPDGVDRSQLDKS